MSTFGALAKSITSHSVVHEKSVPELALKFAASAVSVPKGQKDIQLQSKDTSNVQRELRSW
jgi:hypothetical protein